MFGIDHPIHRTPLSTHPLPLALTPSIACLASSLIPASSSSTLATPSPILAAPPHPPQHPPPPLLHQIRRLRAPPPPSSSSIEAKEAAYAAPGCGWRWRSCCRKGLLARRCMSRTRRPASRSGMACTKRKQCARAGPDAAAAHGRAGTATR